MGLYIGNTLVTAPLADSNVLLLAQLAAPVFFERENSAIETVDPDKTLFVLQREYAIIDLTHLANRKEFVGSYGLAQCIFLRIINESDVLIAHIDTQPINLIDALSHFKNQTPMRAILIGGECCPDTDISIKNALSALFDAANYYQIEIKITTQFLKERVASTKTLKEKMDFIYDRMLTKGNYVSHYLFNRPLDKNKLNDFTPNNLSKLSIGPLRKRTEFFINLVYTAHRAMYQMSIDLPKIISYIFSHGVNEDQFYKYMKELFSQEGYEYFSKLYNIDNSFLPGKTTQFLMPIFKDEVYAISSHFPVKEKNYRFAIFFDSLTKKTMQYNSIYDSNKRELILNPLSFAFVKNCKFAESLLSHSIITDEIVNQATQLLNIEYVENPDIALQDKLLEIILDKGYQIAKPILQKKVSFSFNFSNKKMIDYYEENKIENTAILQLICEQTNIYFQGYRRRFPSDFVDAIHEYSTLREAENVQNLILDALKIKPYIIKFKDTLFLLCIASINLPSIEKVIQPSGFNSAENYSLLKK